MADIVLNEELYRRLRGTSGAPFSVAVSDEQISAYAAAIGARDPLHYDAEVARAAGYRDVVAPPTLGMTLAFISGQADLILTELGLTVYDGLHGEQSFSYQAPLCAGDILRGRQSLDDIYEKKNGTLLFVFTRFEFDNQRGERVLEMNTTAIFPLKGVKLG